MAIDSWKRYTIILLDPFKGIWDPSLWEIGQICVSIDETLTEVFEIEL